MAHSKKPLPSEPPELPELTRKLKFGRWQLLALGLIMLIPALAAFEVFGEGTATATHRGTALAMSIDYPPRIRHGSLETVSVLVANTGGSALDTVTVQFDSSFLARFTDPQFVPSATRAYEVELFDISPGETGRVQLAVRANEYGRHRGRIVASHPTGTATVSISTIVFP